MFYKIYMSCHLLIGLIYAARYWRSLRGAGHGVSVVDLVWIVPGWPLILYIELIEWFDK